MRQVHILRKLLVAPLFAVGLMLTTVAPAAAAPATVEPSDVWGLWSGTDVDGSRVSLIVAGVGSSDEFQMIYFDDLATVACDEVPALLMGKATLSGDTLYGSIAGLCFDGTTTGPFEVKWHFDAGPPSTLTDNFGVVYTR